MPEGQRSGNPQPIRDQYLAVLKRWYAKIFRELRERGPLPNPPAWVEETSIREGTIVRAVIGSGAGVRVLRNADGEVIYDVATELPPTCERCQQALATERLYGSYGKLTFLCASCFAAAQVQTTDEG